MNRDARVPIRRVILAIQATRSSSRTMSNLSDDRAPQVVEHVPGEVELGEIHVTIDRAQDAGGAQEAVVATGMNRVEPVAQCSGPRDLQHDRRRHVSDAMAMAVSFSTTSSPPPATPMLMTGVSISIGQDAGIGFLDETAEGFRPAEAQDMRTRRIAFRRAESQGRARINYRRMIWRRSVARLETHEIDRCLKGSGEDRGLAAKKTLSL
jgi:hypothetical protein